MIDSVGIESKGLAQQNTATSMSHETPLAGRLARSGGNRAAVRELALGLAATLAVAPLINRPHGCQPPPSSSRPLRTDLSNGESLVRTIRCEGSEEIGQ